MASLDQLISLCYNQIDNGAMQVRVDIEWNREREWPGRYHRSLMQYIVADWREECVSIDLYDKLAERHISKADIWATLTSPESYIARYWYYNGNRAHGSWSPGNRAGGQVRAGS